MKRITSVITALCIALLLCACSQKGTDGSDVQDSSGAATVSGVFGYHIEYDALPAGMSVTCAQTASGDSVYIAGFSSGDVLHFGKLSSGEFEEYQLPESIGYIHAITVCGDELWVLAGNCPRYWQGTSDMLQHNEQERYGLFLIGYDSGANITKIIEADSQLTDGTRFTSLRYYNGDFYILSRTGLYQLSGDGTLLNSRLLDGGQFFGQAVSTENYYVCYLSSAADGGQDGINIDVLTSPQDFGFETYLFDNENNIIGIGVDDAGAVFVNTESSLIYAKPALEGSIYSFSENGILDSIYNEIIAFDGGYLLVKPSQNRIAKLVYGEANTQKTVLRLWATAETGTLISLVEDFNVSDPDYTLVIETEYDLGSERIRAEIMSGGGPDIYALAETLEFDGISGSTIFEDLYPYLEKSRTFSAGDFVPTVIKTLETDNSLYVLPLDFSIRTAVKRTDLLADGGLSAALSLPQVEDGSVSIFPQNVSQNDMFYWLSNMYLNDHMKNGKCDFNTEEYLSILKACASISMKEDDGTPSIYSVENISRLLRLLYLQEAYGDEFTFQSGLGSCLFVSQSLAISNTSANKDGAWRFLEFALSSGASQTSDAAFPVLTAELSAMLDEGSTSGVWRYKTNTFEKLTPHSSEEIRSLIESTYCALDQYPPLIEIMKEEATKYFCGDRSVEETAQVTQSRADIYLAERYN